MSSAASRVWRKQHRNHLRKLLGRYKTLKGCADCGYRAHPAALDFDHRDPKLKQEHIANLVAQSPSRASLWREVSKCDVVCANCHRIRTHNSRVDSHDEG